MLARAPVCSFAHYFPPAFGRQEESRGAILVAIGVAADDDGLGPAWHQAWHVAADDGLAENGPAQNVADGAIGRLPHLLEAEFLHAGFIWRDGGALHSHADPLDGVRRLDRHPVFGGVAMLDAEVVIVQLDV